MKWLLAELLRTGGVVAHSNQWRSFPHVQRRARCTPQAWRLRPSSSMLDVFVALPSRFPALLWFPYSPIYVVFYTSTGMATLVRIGRIAISAVPSSSVVSLTLRRAVHSPGLAGGFRREAVEYCKDTIAETMAHRGTSPLPVTWATPTSAFSSTYGLVRV